MLLNFAFSFLMIAACVPALVWGGSEGRKICLMFLIAALATYFGATTLKKLVTLPDATIIVDLILLGGLLHVAVRTDRYWPLWICAFHMLSVLSFLAWQFVPNSPLLFKAISGIWSIPELIVLCVGPILDLRQSSSQELRSAEDRRIER
ncbi:MULTISPECIES: hypothetical protein [unclassified Novosphingobium]|uniref:hypothetical protein n=1 Tax=unclassified Novosphingobium TaxID=2644732 RepID=UPI00135A868F|nr:MULTISPECIES: hypothetical protein [unclassified Novosphingobium]